MFPGMLGYLEKEENQMDRLGDTTGNQDPVPAAPGQNQMARKSQKNPVPTNTQEGPQSPQVAQAPVPSAPARNAQTPPEQDQEQKVAARATFLKDLVSKLD